MSTREYICTAFFLLVNMMIVVFIVNRYLKSYQRNGLETFENALHTKQKVLAFMDHNSDGVFYKSSLDQSDDTAQNKKITIFKGKNVDFKADRTIFKSRTRFANALNEAEQPNDINFNDKVRFTNLLIFSKNSSIKPFYTEDTEDDASNINAASFSSIKKTVNHLNSLMPDADYDLDWDDKKERYDVKMKIPEITCSFDDKAGKNKSGCLTSMWSAVNAASTSLNGQVCSCCCNKYLQKKETKIFTYVRMFDVPLQESTVEIAPGGEHFINLAHKSNLRNVILKQTHEQLNSKLFYVKRNGAVTQAQDVTFSSTATQLTEIDNLQYLHNKVIHLFHYHPGCHNDQCKHKVIWGENNEMKKQDEDDYNDESDKSKYEWKLHHVGQTGHGKQAYHIESLKNPGSYLYLDNKRTSNTDFFTKYSTTVKQQFFFDFIVGADGYFTGEFRLGFDEAQIGGWRHMYIFLESGSDRRDIEGTYNPWQAYITWKFKTTDGRWGADLVSTQLKITNDFYELPTEDTQNADINTEA